MTHAAPSEPDDPTRPRRMALDAARQYYLGSAESANYDVQRSQLLALQGILRCLIYYIEAEDVQL